MTDTVISDLKIYRCRVAPRDKSPLGADVIPWIKEKLTGEELILRPMWVGNEDDRYPGEWAMMLTRPDWHRVKDQFGEELVWIASGDVEILEELDREEFMV